MKPDYKKLNARCYDRSVLTELKLLTDIPDELKEDVFDAAIVSIKKGIRGGKSLLQKSLLEKLKADGFNIVKPAYLDAPRKTGHLLDYDLITNCRFGLRLCGTKIVSCDVVYPYPIEQQKEGNEDGRN